MRINPLNGLLLGLAFSLVAASGCSTAPTAAPANPAPALPVQPAGGQPVQQLAPVDPCPQPLAAAPLAAPPCDPCGGIGAYGPYGPYGYPFGAAVSTVFFDPFAFNSVVVDSVVVRDDVRPNNVIRDTDVSITGSGNKVVFNQGGRGGSRIDNLGIEINGEGNTVKIKQGTRRK